ncbi:hypothetical protein [Arenicella xantha]|uniref:Uncharacterized protein n=1 Tax=Arenicella xantha TaxID=644221 RepID=A0A395JKP6_9GAMM|nr:hypothetical protein [Arenicella xantha]RBP51005.1 hypothetical protein DFR28_102422 [Arenicella xantha]
MSHQKRTNLTSDLASENLNNELSATEQARRKQLLMIAGVAGGTLLLTGWGKPIVNAIVLPAHAQTSICTTDTVVGGPLAGNASGATSCQTACEAEAADQSAQLCRVEESLDAMSATQCSCELDLPN